MTVREFVYAIDVSESFLVRHENPIRYVRAALSAQVEDTELRGPRGGLYERIGSLWFDEGYRGDHGFITGTRTFVVRTKARYVRPKR